MQQYRIVSAGLMLQPDHNAAVFSKFNRVTGDVHQDLINPQWIANQRIRHIGIDLQRQFQLLVKRIDRQQFHRIVYHIAD